MLTQFLHSVEHTLFFQWSVETVYWHFHHPAKTINRFLCLLIVFLKSKKEKHQLNFEGRD